MRGFLAKEVDATMQFVSTIQAQGDKIRVLGSGGSKTIFKGVPSFKELGFSGDIGLMRRIIVAPTGVPADRIAKLKAAFDKLQGDKTYKRLLKAIGETNDFMSGSDYEKMRPAQSDTFKALVKSLAAK